MFYDVGDGGAPEEWVAFISEPPEDIANHPPLDALPAGVVDDDPGLLSRLRILGDTAQAVALAIGSDVRTVSDRELVAALDQLHEIANLLAPIDQALIAEADRRGVFRAHCAPTIASWLVKRLHVRPTDAAARVRAARAFTDRSTLQGEWLPAVRPQVAAAQLDGSISADHAVVTDRALERLHDGLPVDVLDAAEAAMVRFARHTDPADLARLARIIVDQFNQDGTAPDDDADRRRTLSVRQREDGTGDIRGRLTPELVVLLQTVLSPLAAPRPADANGPDPRSAGQRNHDALDDALVRLLRAGDLPDAGGVPVSVSVIMQLPDLLRGSGIAQTEFGTIPVARVLQLATECEYIPVVLNDAGGVVSYGVTRRCAPPGMAKALRARDRGCTFPGCQRPAGWTERHHIREHHLGGDTALDNLTLLCRFHHRNFGRHGWTVRMVDGRPWWIPPAQVDPDRRPVRNTHWDTPSDPLC